MKRVSTSIQNLSLVNEMDFGLGRLSNPVLPAFLLLVSLLLVASPITATSLQLETLLPEDPFAGGKLFVSKGCVVCHAIHGEGGTSAPDLGRVRLKGGYLQIAGDMWNHSPGMDEMFRATKLVRPELTSEEISQIIAFVYFLNHLDEPGDPTRGMRLFKEKGCVRCHAVGGKGGRIAGSLDRFAMDMSPVFLTTALWNRGQDMARMMKSLGMNPPVFEGTEINDIIAYIRAESKPGQDYERVFLPPGNPVNGGRLFVSKGCVRCHAIKGRGWHMGPDLGSPKIRGSLTTIAGFQWNHGPKMWAKMEEIGMPIPRFTVTQMSDVITYLYFTQYVEEPGNAEVGKRLFSEKGCSYCHATDGDTTSLAPSVSDMEEFRTPTDVISAMWNHASEMESLTWEMDISWPLLKHREMAHLVAYLRSGHGKK